MAMLQARGVEDPSLHPRTVLVILEATNAEASLEEGQGLEARLGELLREVGVPGREVGQVAPVVLAQVKVSTSATRRPLPPPRSSQSQKTVGAEPQIPITTEVLPVDMTGKLIPPPRKLLHHN